MHTQHVNWIAVVVAAISTFVLGGLWYSPQLFGRIWLATNGLTEADLAKGNRLKIFAWSFLLSLAMSANLAMFLAEPKTNAAWGATAGFLAGFGWVALSLAIVGMFERRSWTYIFINGGYLTVSFVLMGLIIGAWR